MTPGPFNGPRGPFKGPRAPFEKTPGSFKRRGRGVKIKIFVPVFLGFSPEIDPGTPLDRPGAPRTSICTKNQPRRPILMPFRDNSGDRRPATVDRRPATVDRRPATADRRPATADRRPETVFIYRPLTSVTTGGGVQGAVT